MKTLTEKDVTIERESNLVTIRTKKPLEVGECVEIVLEKHPIYEKCNGSDIPNKIIGVYTQDGKYEIIE